MSERRCPHIHIGNVFEQGYFSCSRPPSTKPYHTVAIMAIRLKWIAMAWFRENAFLTFFAIVSVSSLLALALALALSALISALCISLD